MRAHILRLIELIRSDRKRSLILAGVSGALIIGILLLWWIFSAPEARPSAQERILKPHVEDHVQGDLKVARAVLVVYSDFECSACSVYHSVLKQLKVDMGDDIAIIYRHLPLTAIHPNAELAAIAVEAAGAQGKFFEMHDRLFETQTAWVQKDTARDFFMTQAQALELDMPQFTEDLEEKSIRRILSRHKNEARELSFKSAPTFFLNGTLLPTFHTYAEFKAHIINTVYTQ